MIIIMNRTILISILLSTFLLVGCELSEEQKNNALMTELALNLPITFLQAFWLVVVVTLFLSVIAGEIATNNYINSTPIEQREQYSGTAGWILGLMVWVLCWTIGLLVFLNLFIW